MEFTRDIDVNIRMHFPILTYKHNAVKSLRTGQCTILPNIEQVTGVILYKYFISTILQISIRYCKSILYMNLIASLIFFFIPQFSIYKYQCPFLKKRTRIVFVSQRSISLVIYTQIDHIFFIFGLRIVDPATCSHK